jgi:hypothetical protein
MSGKGRGSGLFGPPSQALTTEQTTEPHIHSHKPRPSKAEPRTKGLLITGNKGLRLLLVIGDGRNKKQEGSPGK